MKQNIIDEVRAIESEMNLLLKQFLPCNQSKFWLETNNAQREKIHEKFTEYKKAVARLMLSSEIINQQSTVENNTEDWAKNFKI